MNDISMKRIPMYLAIGALALSSATATVYAVSAITISAQDEAMIRAAEIVFRENSEQGNNVAFRDGLYEGKLAAKRGVNAVPAIGRWNLEADRVSFTEGYRQAVSESLAANR
jgi:hypothetical protein